MVYKGDYARIKTSLDHLSTALHKVFDQIGQASNAVSSGAGEVSQGSGCLSDSVAGQTRLIDEIAAGMADLQERIDRIIIGINEESHGQRERVDEVSGKLGHVSEYVSASAANALESAGAAQELDGQAAMLKGMIDDFRLQLKRRERRQEEIEVEWV